ncbi:MAG: response regulator [Acidobacteriota bacterium]
MSSRVLVVDDDPSLRRLLSLVMQRAGIESDTAGDAHDAIRKLEQTQYSLVLLDLQLGETSGHDVLNWQRTHDHPAGVIVTTGQEDQLGLAAPSIRRVVKKPYDLKTVTDLIVSLLPAAEPALGEKHR